MLVTCGLIYVEVTGPGMGELSSQRRHKPALLPVPSACLHGIPGRFAETVQPGFIKAANTGGRAWRRLYPCRQKQAVPLHADSVECLKAGG